jgi:hypothetical protein
MHQGAMGRSHYWALLIAMAGNDVWAHEIFITSPPSLANFPIDIADSSGGILLSKTRNKPVFR